MRLCGNADAFISAAFDSRMVYFFVRTSQIRDLFLGSYNKSFFVKQQPIGTVKLFFFLNYFFISVFFFSMYGANPETDS
jgi:hypothetical protein